MSTINGIFFSLKNIGTGFQYLSMKCFEIFDLESTNYFLKMCPIIVSSHNDFGRSDNDIIEWKNDGFH